MGFLAPPAPFKFWKGPSFFGRARQKRARHCRDRFPIPNAGTDYSIPVSSTACDNEPGTADRSIQLRRHASSELTRNSSPLFVANSSQWELRQWPADAAFDRERAVRSENQRQHALFLFASMMLPRKSSSVRPSWKGSAFSLIEIMVAVAILAVIIV